MRHAAVATPLSTAAARGTRRWRRMRARLGLMAFWAALLVWALGASVRVPGEIAAPPAAASVGPTAPAAHVDLANVDLERAAAWPRESAESWQAPSQEPALDAASEPDPEEEAALYIAGR